MQLKTMYPAEVNIKATVTMGALDANTTTVTVLDGTVLPDAPNILVLGTDQTAETVLMTAKEGNVLTIERGFQGTPKAWNAGTEIARNFTGYDLDTVSENIEAVAEQTDATANLVNGVQSYKSLSELSATASTDLLTIFAAMATPSRLVCDIANGGTTVYPAASGTLCINKTGADTGTASFIYEDGRVATATFTANSSGGGVTLTNWNRLTERVESMCNPNLLINTDFRNPVNQRGQTSYVGAGYGIDCWSIQQETAILSLFPDGITIQNGAIANAIENSIQNLTGKMLTLSVLFSDGIIYEKSGVATTEYGAYSSPIYISSDRGDYFLQYDANNYRVCLQNNAENSIVIAAVKLEVGSFSTLANEVVDYATELRKCQRYLQKGTASFNTEFEGSTVYIPTGLLENTMRIAPTVRYYTKFGEGTVVNGYDNLYGKINGIFESKINRLPAIDVDNPAKIEDLVICEYIASAEL